ncbi:hypothetical protein BP6252_07796 [Coleophoma cylindrospora]|uniref:Uncharacterized protein n=1 Tax=Coleophoma cylindrospora TaxID=1849047 RepID=A0A3D8RB09_9HELO|nr:hypothetical protein BP6252_07796 [Coleophoma cylindrospora]
MSTTSHRQNQGAWKVLNSNYQGPGFTASAPAAQIGPVRRVQRRIALQLQKLDDGRPEFIDNLLSQPPASGSLEPAATLVYSNPDDSSPYVGFMIRIPMSVNALETFFDKDGRKLNHHVDIRFLPNTFTWAYRHIAHDGRDELKKYLKLPDYDLLSVEIKPNPDTSLELYGLPWPSTKGISQKALASILLLLH